MCWVSKKYNERIAEKNLLVYKCVHVRKKYYLFGLIKKTQIYSFAKHFSYKLGKTYKGIIEPNKDIYTYKVGAGFHSYKIKHDYCMESSIYYMLCIIPKGTKYAVSDIYENEVVSEKIRPIRLYESFEKLMEGTIKYSVNEKFIML